MRSSDADDKICLSDAEASAEDVCGPSTSDSENVLDETTDELSDEAIKKKTSTKSKFSCRRIKAYEGTK